MKIILGLLVMGIPFYLLFGYIAVDSSTEVAWGIFLAILGAVCVIAITTFLGLLIMGEV
jgi:hypothetical protein